MSNSRFAREARPQLPGELVDDGSFQCCVRIGRSCLLCGKKSSHFPYTWFVGPDWYCMCVTYTLIIVPTVLFIRNVAIYYGAPVIVIAVILCAVTLGFFSMTACSDPGIIFDMKEIESTHHDEGNDIEIMTRSPSQSQPYSPVRSTDLIHADIPDRPREPELLNGERMEDIEEGFTNDNYHSHDSKPIMSHNATALATPFESSVMMDGAANRIIVGAAQRASRGANLNHSSSSSSSNSSSTNALASTQINAPYLPPPSKIECGRCQLLRPRDASHCHDCGVCVKKLDHHCPWTGKCIGEKTIKMFYAFLISLCVLIAFVVIVVVVAFAQAKDIFNF